MLADVRSVQEYRPANSHAPRPNAVRQLGPTPSFLKEKFSFGLSRAKRPIRLSYGRDSPVKK